MTVQQKRLYGSRLLNIIIILLMAISMGNNNLFFEIIGFVFIVLGAMGRVWSATYISGFKSGKIVQDGPYSMMRNPLYFFSVLIFIGVGLSFGSILITVLLIGVFLITHLPTIMAEEKKLESLFGDEYRQYFNKVPRFFPSFKLYYNPEEILFHPRKFTKTLIEAIFLVFIVIIIKVIIWMHLSGILPTYLHII